MPHSWNDYSALDCRDVLDPILSCYERTGAPALQGQGCLR